MRRKRALIIQGLLVLGLMACLLVSCGKKGLRFNDYPSEEEWRMFLLRQVPLGSSVDDVMAFLSGQGFRQEPDPESGVSCDHYTSPPNWLMVKICDEWWSNGGYWLVGFQFDEDGKLREISVELGPT